MLTIEWSRLGSQKWQHKMCRWVPWSTRSSMVDCPIHKPCQPILNMVLNSLVPNNPRLPFKYKIYPGIQFYMDSLGHCKCKPTTNTKKDGMCLWKSQSDVQISSQMLNLPDHHAVVFAVQCRKQKLSFVKFGSRFMIKICPLISLS